MVYGSLSLVLLALYLTGILLLQGLFRAAVGQTSDLAVVASTLTIAGLFQSLRHRLQVLIDHQFYRRRYDATQTLAAFSVRVRDEVDLASLTNDLVRVVDQTVQPAHVTLWLHPSRPAGTVQPRAPCPYPP